MAAATYRPQSPAYGYEILRTLPKPQASFTQGLQRDGDVLLESSGHYGRSFVQRVRITDGHILHQHRLPRNRFAEGAAVIGDVAHVLTWRSGELLRFDRRQLQPLSSLRYDGEGWGLTAIDDQLLMSDGSARLCRHRSIDFRRLDCITVRESGRPVQLLNDLTFDGEYIWANVWKESRVLVINPASGDVVAQLPLQALADMEDRHDDDEVLNGLAWDAGQQALWVTGKYWRNYYLLRLLPPAGSTAAIPDLDQAGSQ